MKHQHLSDLIYLGNRSQVVTEYDGKCADCGREFKHVHHIDHNQTNHEISNLIPLCCKCHKAKHNPLHGIEMAPIITIHLTDTQTHKQFKKKLINDGMKAQEFFRKVVKEYLEENK